MTDPTGGTPGGPAGRAGSAEPLQPADSTEARDRAPSGGLGSRKLQSVALAFIGLVLLAFFLKDADFAAIAA
ncbi:MAG: hypothetical protein V3U22_07735, partial [Vicinamibacteria bacterium]